MSNNYHYADIGNQFITTSNLKFLSCKNINISNESIGLLLSNIDNIKYKVLYQNTFRILAEKCENLDFKDSAVAMKPHDAAVKFDKCENVTCTKIDFKIDHQPFVISEIGNDHELG